MSDSDSEEEEEGISGVEEGDEVAGGDAEVADGQVQQRQDEDQQQESAEPGSSRRKKPNPRPPPPLWVEVSAINSAKQMPAWLDSLPEPNEVDTPIDYFRQFFDENIMATIVEQSNL